MEDPIERTAPKTAGPLLTVGQQIARLKAKGVTFDLCGEEEAAEFLRSGNNYLRAESYRVLYPRQTEGPHVGRYINLDFGDLVALSSLDRQLRETFLLITVDVEHFAKMKLLRHMEDAGEDGHSIVKDFYASLNHAGRNAIQGSLNKRSRQDEGHDAYVGDLIAHNRDDMPAWVLLEVLDFGGFLTFYKYCSERWGDTILLQKHYALKSVKALRNAVAHNHCVVNGFVQSGESASYTTPEVITDALNAAGVGRTKARRAKLSNLRMAQIAASLYCLSAFCTRESTARRHHARLCQLRASYDRNAGRYALNSSLVSFFGFLWKLVDIWSPDTRE